MNTINFEFKQTYKHDKSTYKHKIKNNKKLTLYIENHKKKDLFLLYTYPQKLDSRLIGFDYNMSFLNVLNSQLSNIYLQFAFDDHSMSDGASLIELYETVSDFNSYFKYSFELLFNELCDTSLFTQELLITHDLTINLDGNKEHDNNILIYITINRRNQ